MVTHHMRSGMEFSACDILQSLNNLDYWRILYLKVFRQGMFSLSSVLYLWYGFSFMSSMPSHFLLPDAFVQSSPFFLTWSGDEGGSCAGWRKRPLVAYLQAGFDGGDYRLHTISRLLHQHSETPLSWWRRCGESRLSVDSELWVDLSQQWTLSMAWQSTLSLLRTSFPWFDVPQCLTVYLLKSSNQWSQGIRSHRFSTCRFSNKAQIEVEFKEFKQ